MMTFDMTAQLAPVLWGTVGLLIVSAAGIVATALPTLRAMTKRASGPTAILRPASLSASA